MRLRSAALTVALALAPAAAADAATNSIYTVAGSSIGSSGDGGLATLAHLSDPSGVVSTSDGGYLIADAGNHVVRKVAANGLITRVAGNGNDGTSGDGGPATAAAMRFPQSVSVTADGSLLIADPLADEIRRVAPGGTITRVAGVGTYGFSGDGGPATSAELGAPVAVAALPGGGFLIADSDNNRVRRVAPDGKITSVAGTGSPTFSGDGGPAPAAAISAPWSLAVRPDGSYLIADRDNNRIRLVSAAGTITTVAGDGANSPAGDGGPATAASLSGPRGVATAPDGGFLIADNGNNVVRRVSPSGRITTVAGDGGFGFGGDGGPATLAEFQAPVALSATADGGVLVADANNSRIRFVDADLRAPATGPRGPRGAPGPAGGTVKVDRLVAALHDSRLTVRRGRRARVRYVATMPASAVLALRHGTKTLARVSGRAHSGRNAIALKAKKPGRYRLRLTLRSKDGQRFADEATLVVTR